MSRPKPEFNDTGEFIVPELGYQRAQNYARAQAERIVELENAVREMARYIHTRLHPLGKTFKDCEFVACRKARRVLKPHPGLT